MTKEILLSQYMRTLIKENESEFTLNRELRVTLIKWCENLKNLRLRFKDDSRIQKQNNLPSRDDQRLCKRTDKIKLDKRKRRE